MFVGELDASRGIEASQQTVAGGDEVLGRRVWKQEAGSPQCCFLTRATELQARSYRFSSLG